jgi:hypothetical protein
MKIKHSIVSLALVMLALCPFARAANQTVSSLTTSTVSTIILPGPHATWITITNATTANGGNQVNLGLDGGTQNSDQYNLKVGADPTTGATGKGYWLAPGQSITLYGQFFSGIPIRAIMATGTTVLAISTPDQGSTFPTN